MYVGQGRDAEHQRFGAAGNAGQRGRQHERDQFVIVGAVTQGGRPRLVLADAF